jgi:YD repeat-containing protein
MQVATWMLAYDALGRVTSSSQVTNSQTYTFSAYTWNLAGSLTSITYPSGRVVTTTYDKATRPYQVAGTYLSTPTTYASCPSAVSPTDPCYASHGALTQLLFGNQQTEQTCFNNRLQPFLMRFGTGAVNCSNPPTSPAMTDLLNLALVYGGSNNNGNLQSQAITRQGTTWSQSYGYDKLNRLLTASEGSNWSQTSAYDAFGNRWVTNPTPPNGGDSYGIDLVHNRKLAHGMPTMAAQPD